MFNGSELMIDDFNRSPNALVVKHDVFKLG